MRIGREEASSLSAGHMTAEGEKPKKFCDRLLEIMKVQNKVSYTYPKLGSKGMKSNKIRLILGKKQQQQENPKRNCKYLQNDFSNSHAQHQFVIL